MTKEPNYLNAKDRRRYAAMKQQEKVLAEIRDLPPWSCPGERDNRMKTVRRIQTEIENIQRHLEDAPLDQSKVSQKPLQTAQV